MVIAIIGIMSVILAPSYAVYKRDKSMSYAKTQLMNDVRYVQNYTLSSKIFPSTFMSPAGGYGIHFTTGANENTYTIFGDLSADHHYESGEWIETVGTVNNVKITQIRVNKGAGWVAMTSVDYVCVPPYGKIYIDGAQDNVTLEITFSNGVNADVFNLKSSGFIS